MTLGGLFLAAGGIALAGGLYVLVLALSTSDGAVQEAAITQPAVGPPRERILPPTPRPRVAPTPTPRPAPSGARPTRMIIKEIGVDSAVTVLGLDPNALPEVPNDGQAIAWYDFSSEPQSGSNAVFAGHVTWDFGPAVFWRLKELKKGDVIRVELKGGTEVQYRVTENVTLGWDDPQTLDFLAATPDEVITLVTCGGTWIPDLSQRQGGTYSQRTIVRAAAISESDTIVKSASAFGAN